MDQPNAAPATRDTAVATPERAKRIDRKPRLRDGRLYWRGNTIWCVVADPSGAVTPKTGKPALVRKSTGCTSEVAAIAKANEFELRAANPTVRASAGYTLVACANDYCDHLLTKESKARRGHTIKSSTVEKIRADKFGMFVAYCESIGFDGGEMPLTHIFDASWTTGYTKWRQGHSARREDGKAVSNYTIKRELNYLRAALKRAAFYGRFHLPMERVFDPDFSASCRKVTRVPSPEQLSSILDGLRPARAAMVAFSAVTGLRLSELRNITRAHVDLVEQKIVVAGGADGTGKSAESVNEIPITPAMEATGLLSFALAHAPGGATGPLFAAWVNPTLQIKRVCKRVGMTPFGIHDMRRYFAHMHLDAGMSEVGVSKLLRQANPNLVSEIYGKTRRAEKLVQRFGHELRVMPAAVALKSRVPNSYVQGGLPASNGSQESHAAQANKASSVDLSSLSGAVHGPRAETHDLAVTAGEVADAGDATVRVSYEVPAASDTACGNGLAVEAVPSTPRPVCGPPVVEAAKAGPGAPQGGHDGAFPMGEAMALVRRLFASAAATQAERDVLAQALAVLTREPSAAE